MVAGLHMAFAGSPLDRADHVRSDPAALEALQGGGRVLLLDGLSPRLGADGALQWGTQADVEADSEFVFLGLCESGEGHFAPVAPAASGSVAPADAGLWQALSRMGETDTAIYGGARSLVDWHARHRFCARCGSATVLAKGGWQRNCTAESCGAQHFPRVDPVTIMLVEHEGRLLLGRQPRFPEGFYSALAGFVEPGETMEEAVAREVFEEAGVRVRDVRYVGSQPWPFPSSLMIGCHALTDDPAIRIDETELEDARWFSRAEVAAALAGDGQAGFTVPPARAIAHHLLRWWMDRDDT